MKGLIFLGIVYLLSLPMVFGMAPYMKENVFHTEYLKLWQFLSMWLVMPFFLIISIFNKLFKREA